MPLTKETKDLIFEHMKDFVVHQRKVRRCEIEGGVFALEKDIDTLHDLSLITLEQNGILLDMLEENQNAPRRSIRLRP